MSKAFFVRGKPIPIKIDHIPKTGGNSSVKIFITVDTG
jgi:hypothetical protein